MLWFEISRCATSAPRQGRLPPVGSAVASRSNGARCSICCATGSISVRSDTRARSCPESNHRSSSALYSNRVRNPGDHLLTGWVATSDLCPRTRRIAKIAAACGTATRGILAAARLLGTNARSWSTLQGLHHGTGGASPSRRKQIRNNSACPNAVANAAEVWLPCDKSRMSVAEPCAPDVRAVQLLLKSLERVHRTC